MIYLLVKEKGKKQYSLYCPDTYGADSWGSTAQTSIIKKRKSWYINSWWAGNEWIEDEEDQIKLNVVLETSDFDEIFSYVKEHNEKEIEHLIKEARDIYNDYLDLCEWVYAAYKNH
jgi:hypothetical protein